jgi:hypothetical protein
MKWDERSTLPQPCSIIYLSVHFCHDDVFQWNTSELRLSPIDPQNRFAPWLSRLPLSHLNTLFRKLRPPFRANPFALPSGF